MVSLMKMGKEDGGWKEMMTEERKDKWLHQWYLSAPLLFWLGDDLVVGVAHHGDQHVQQQDGHQDHEDGKHNLRQRRVPWVVEHLILSHTHTMHGNDSHITVLWIIKNIGTNIHRNTAIIIITIIIITFNVSCQQLAKLISTTPRPVITYWMPVAHIFQVTIS